MKLSCRAIRAAFSLGICFIVAIAASTSIARAANASAELLVRLCEGADVASFAADHGLTLQRSLQSAADTYVFTAASPQRAAELVVGGPADARVTGACLNQPTHEVVSYGFVPNDPLFGPSGGFAGQWSLSNQIGTGVDANVVAAWNRNVTGLGVTIGIVDDCLQITHPDLQANYSAADSYNFGSYVGHGAPDDPSPYNATDKHGTSVAGIAAARGGNGVGVTGVAPDAQLAGLRVDFEAQSVDQFYDATLYHSSGDDTSIKVKNHSYGVPDPFAWGFDTELQREALHISTLAGTIHCFAAGNDRGQPGEDANKKHLPSSPDAITVTAVGSDGKFTYYGNYGANVFVCAPSGDAVRRITTTDLVGANGYNPSVNSDYADLAYTARFSGTSAATPLVAGALALAKQVQPNLDTRFAKHLLARTCMQVDPSDATKTGGGDGVTPGSAWTTNGAGLKFDQNYGFGMIDVDRLTREAVNYVGVTPLVTTDTGTQLVGATIPDNDPAGIVRSLLVAGTTAPLEDVLVTLDISLWYRGDVAAWLTSPSGTICRILSTAGDSGSDIIWQFDANAFWGENANGVWSMKVADLFESAVGSWNAWSMELRMGSLIAVPEPATAVMALVAVALIWLRCRAMFRTTG